MGKNLLVRWGLGFTLDFCIYEWVKMHSMQNLIISPKVLEKLKGKHGIVRKEVEQCFHNRSGKLLIDDRALRKTNPPTLWFLSKTNKGRLLKIVYIQIGNKVHLKSAFDPIAIEIAIYARHG